MRSIYSVAVSAIALLSITAACGRSDDSSMAPSYVSDSAIVNINIVDYDSVKNGYIEAFVYTYEGLSEVTPQKVNADGSVALKFDLNGDAVVLLMNASTGDHYGRIRIAPETTDVTVYPDSIATNGKFAELNKVMYNYRSKYSMRIFEPSFVSYDMSGDDYTAAVINKYNELKNALDADNTLSPIERDIEENSLINSVLSFMSNRTLVNRCSYLSKNTPDNPISADAMVNEMSDANYAAVIAAIDADSESLLSGGLDIASSLNNVDWSAKGAAGTLLGAVSDYQLAAKEAEECRTDSARVKSLSRYSNPFFAAAVENIRAGAQKRFDDAVSMISKLPADMPGDKIVETVIAPYKGKVVMIDLWNTWCGPCKAAIAENEPLKSTVLNDPDIVFVYIADESSPMPLYVNQIPSIKGEHYRITDNQARELHKQFNLDGIPYYILVDREGNVEGRPDLRDHELYIKTVKEKLQK